MSKNREKVELTIGWDTSFYPEEAIDIAVSLKAESMICFLTDIYNSVQQVFTLYQSPSLTK